ncbi:Trk system potassium transporter TrkA [Roseibacillus persicicus]|uniref:Trk system potassium uptake protein TrkA n=1 Tax=Roseibacillus persicicus TaxID=454148 RepID=A0A918TPK7_9BACT|nr:Trk system potassium transporter TrkA [Roseibacillus persicicus]MDQ8189956.1 Trk system potassium transporter TrkA [Roseibacillus persicicus]GHC51188.1 Trk system potassium transport protein TrkA [Roseibacillus persicicus]
MNIIIVGAGEIGRHLAQELSRSHALSVIEVDSKLAAELEQSIDANVVRGDGNSVNALAEANVGECELFLGLTSSNNANLMSASMAKAMGVERVIARVHPGLQREEWLFDYRGHFNIDHLFSSERLTAIELAKFIRNPDSLTVEELAQGKIELQQVRVHAKSGAIGKPLRELKLPERTRIAAISREDSHLIPNADSTLEAGDIATIFGEPRRLRKLAASLQKSDGGLEGLKVVIFGGGEYGFSLAQMLESWDCKVRIFETDQERCHELADRLANTTVINVDATVLAELEDEQVGDADFFVATSDSDEDNVMTCLQANNIGVKNCLTIIHRADYARAIGSSGRHFGVVAAVSPREATRRDIERYLTSEKYHVVKKLGPGQVIETRIESKSSLAGKPVSEVPWPPGVVLVGRQRGLQAEVPGRDDVLEAGDILYAMVGRKSLKPFVKLLG